MLLLCYFSYRLMSVVKISAVAIFFHNQVLGVTMVHFIIDAKIVHTRRSKGYLVGLLVHLIYLGMSFAIQKQPIVLLFLHYFLML